MKIDNIDIDWIEYRQPDMSIGLIWVFDKILNQLGEKYEYQKLKKAYDYLSMIMELRGIQSRQAAAIAIATAYTMIDKD